MTRYLGEGTTAADCLLVNKPPENPTQSGALRILEHPTSGPRSGGFPLASRRLAAAAATRPKSTWSDLGFHKPGYKSAGL